MSAPLEVLLEQVRACTLCEPHLPLGARPVLQMSANAKLLIIGQAPGTKVHASGVAWDDASGARLRTWLGISNEVFYSDKVAIMPMGFCYPGKGKSGDLAPRPECQSSWHDALLQQLPNVQLTLLIGAYAQSQYLPKPAHQAAPKLTDAVKNFAAYLPQYLPLPHPSPRNNIWLNKHPWFEKQVLPVLRDRVSCLV